jgi:hypothetical protein
MAARTTVPARPHFINRRRIMEKCNIRGCKKPAEFKVILYDVYVHDERVFFEWDFTCLFFSGEDTPRLLAVPLATGYDCWITKSGGHTSCLSPPA